MRRIRNLQVRYVRGARRVDIHAPDKSVIEIAGDNGSGKSSTLDAIEWGIRGKRALPPDPLHHDATEGRVTVDLGDLRITRTITGDNAARGGTVQIQAADGSKWGQRDISELYGAWTFDPLSFARARPDEQAAQVRELAGPEYCARLDALEDQIADARKMRTEAGRRERAYGRVEAPRAVEAVDTTELLARLSEARMANEAHAQAAARVAEHARLLEQAIADSEEAQRRLRAVLAEAKAAEERVAMCKESIPPDPPQPVDLAPIEAELARAAETNAAAAHYEHALSEFRGWQDATREHQYLDAQVHDLEEQRRQHLRTAQLPVPGLSWQGGQIALDGTPFAALSTTEQLLLSARIGMALSPDLRVMLVREGGLIDTQRFVALAELAAAEDYQIWVETAGPGHTPDALVIEAGELDDSQNEWD